MQGCNSFENFNLKVSYDAMLENDVWSVWIC